MRLKDVGEFGFINRISKGCLIRREGVVRAIGDDAAAFRPAAGELALVTTDLLVERVHFLTDAMSGFDLGRKSLAVNLSDIAAMGGTAREAFVSIGIPENLPVDYLEAVYQGMTSLATEYDVNILGGDTTGSKSDLIINVAVTGSVPETEMLLRSTARVGDTIFCTGCLGDSRAGLHLILNGMDRTDDALAALYHAHVRPHPCLREGRFLAASGAVRSAIDVSDGLSSDLRHIVRESGVGARLDADAIPLSDPLKRFCARFGFDPLAFAMDGGEDYTLLCTVGKGRADRLAADYQSVFGSPLIPIGEITATGRMELKTPEGRLHPIRPGGWDHFRKV